MNLTGQSEPVTDVANDRLTVLLRLSWTGHGRRG